MTRDRWQFDDADSDHRGHRHVPTPAVNADLGDWSGPRYSTQPLPAFRFLPGRDAQPESSHLPAFDLPGADPTDWRHCAPYLYAVDCFNHGFWWEAASLWAGLAAGTDPNDADHHCLNGLTRAAEALLRRRMGWRSSVARLRLETERAFARVPETSLMGLQLATWWPSLDRCLRPGGVDFPRLELDGPGSESQENAQYCIDGRKLSAI